jgi:DGQHR domain-containing protein
METHTMSTQKNTVAPGDNLRYEELAKVWGMPGAPGHWAFATIKAKALPRLLFVSTFEASDPDSKAPKKHGYQRPPLEGRFPTIGNYYLQHDNRNLITPLILSVRLSDPDEIAEFIELFNAGEFDEIHRRWHKAIVSTVDGQHRTGGINWAWSQDASFGATDVPVMLYFGLDFQTEAALFDTINSTQRKVPKALIEVTKGDITEIDIASHAQEIRNITFALARDKDSVWFGQLNMTGARDPDKKITYEGLRRSMSNMLTNELIARLKARGESPAQYAKDYWEMISKVSREAWTESGTRTIVDESTGDVTEEPIQYRLKELVGVASLAKLGRDIITSALEHQDPHEKIVDMVSRLSEVDWEKRKANPWMASQAGLAGQKDLYAMLYDLVYLNKRPGEAV